MTHIHESRPGIDHMAQANWNARVLEPMDEAHLAMITDRFKGAFSTIEPLVEAINYATIQTETHRQTHERDNLFRLQLNQDGRDFYNRHAGQSESIGEYVRWFGKAAIAAFNRHDHLYRFDTISLDLGGKRQDGDWNCTRELDTMIRELPKQLAAYSDISLEVAARRRDRRKYLFMPVILDPTDTKSFDFGVLRRRRAVADITETTAESQTRYYVFKQSVGLIVMRQLDPDLSRIITERCNDSNEEERYTKPANAAGSVFETALRSNRDYGREVVPISAQYVVKARREQNQVALPVPAK